MSAPPAAAAKDALYEQPAVEVKDGESESSASDVVGDSTAAAHHHNPAPAASARPPPQQQQQQPDEAVMRLHEDEMQPPTSPPAVAASTAASALSSPHAAAAKPREEEEGDAALCCQCGQPMGGTRGAVTKDGPLHPQCIAEYKFLHQPRCRYCNIRFRDDEVSTFVKDPETGYLFHPECRAQAEAGRAYVQPTMEGEVRKFAVARSKLSRHNWKTRYFVLSPANGGIRYYADKAAAAAGSGGGAADRKGSDAKSDGSASYDADADPDREANEAKRSKGVVPLNSRSRLLTRPSHSNFKISSSSATDDDIGIIFYASPDSEKELRLIFQCDSLEQRAAWLRALEAYIATVDDPADYTAMREAARERELEREREKERAEREAREKAEKEEKKKKEKEKKK